MKRGVLVAVAGGVVVVAVVVVLVVARSRHAGKVGPNELFASALDAAHRGDQTALLAMHVSAGAARVTTCAAKTADTPDDSRHGRYSSDPDEMKQYETKQLHSQLHYWKDRVVTLGPLTEHGEPEAMPPTNASSHERCKSTATVTVHDYDTTLTAKDGDHTRTSHVILGAAEIDGDWYFFDLPPPPTTAADLSRLRDLMCKCATDASPSACADKVQRGVDRWTRGVQDADLLAIEAEITQCRAQAMR